MYYLQMAPFLLRIVVGLILGIGLASLPAHALQVTPLERVTLLVRSGASDLALRVLNELQPATSETSRWIQWEKMRFSILQQRKEWDALIARVAQLPAELPLLQQQQLLTDAAETLLSSGQGTAARRFLRELLWRTSGDSKQISNWRRLIIRSYLEQDDGLENARIAMQRYQKEYLPNDKDWAYLFGRISLLSGKSREAAAQLATVQTQEGRLLRLSARLLSGIDNPDVIAEQARELMSELPEDSKLRPRVWGLLVMAGKKGANKHLTVSALEQFITLSTGRDELYAYSASDLWRSYLDLAQEIGNAENLLVGDPAPWLQLAVRYKSDRPESYRALYAMLAINSENPVSRGRYFLQVYRELKEIGLHDTAVRLFIDSPRFAAEGDIPPGVRHEIVQYAIVRRDIPLAARMARGLEDPGVRQDGIDWALVRARLALYTGRSEEAVTVLHRLFDSVSSFEPKVSDRVMQVLFDMQEVGEHGDAYILFDRMYHLVGEEKRKREILFWMADALKGSKKYEQAAEMYFRSALAAENSFDFWGQTARYRAAEALAENGSLADARKVYEQLIKVTRDPKRVLALERKMQGLWLKDQQKVN